MPRHRVILVVWLTIAVLLLGAWGHSLFHKSHLVYRSPALERHFQIGLAAGSLIIKAHIERPLFNSGFSSFSERWQTEPDPFSAALPETMPPPFYAGRFRTGDGYLELPLWALLLALTICLLPLHLRFTEQRRESPTMLLLEKDPAEAKRVEDLNFKIY